MAMLAVIHRAVLRQGPRHFHRFFQFKMEMPRFVRHWHSRQIIDPCEQLQPDYFKRSIFGLIGIYNALPEFIIACESVKEFQHRLQLILKYLACCNFVYWSSVFHRFTLQYSVLSSITEAAILHYEETGQALPIPLHVLRLHSTI